MTKKDEICLKKTKSSIKNEKKLSQHHNITSQKWRIFFLQNWKWIDNFKFHYNNILKRRITSIESCSQKRIHFWLLKKWCITWCRTKEIRFSFSIHLSINSIVHLNAYMIWYCFTYHHEKLNHVTCYINSIVSTIIAALI